MGVEKNPPRLILVSGARWSADHILDFVRPYQHHVQNPVVTRVKWSVQNQ